MSSQRANHEDVNNLPTAYHKVDRRYRESNYFLMDQLQYSESVQEFRSIKQAILNSTQFQVAKRSFRFATVAVTND